MLEVNKLNKLKISLAAARVNAEMTQEDVAKEMHVSKNTVNLVSFTICHWSIFFYPNNQIKFDAKIDRGREVRM